MNKFLLDSQSDLKYRKDMYLMLLIYKNHLTENLHCIRKNSAENTSFFSKVFDKSASSLHVNND